MSEFTRWKQLRESLPVERTPLVDQCIHVLESLPGVSGWTPPGPFSEGSIPLDLVRWGFPFTFLTDVLSLEPLRTRIGTRIGEGHCPEPSDYSEASAAALVKVLGARNIERVDELDTRTPDFRVWWGNDFIEMEVTRADQKESQIRRTIAQSRINEQIRSYGRQYDILVQMVDTLSEEDIQQVLRAVCELEEGDSREIFGKWRVRAETPSRQGNYHVVGSQSDTAPSWWPESKAVRLFSLTSQFGGQEPNKVYPQVRFQFATPLDGYMNTASRKAERFQGSGNVPFLIAIDVMALPGAIEYFPRELPAYFAGWPRVSGVLLTHGPAFMGNRLGWMWKLILNENECCLNPVPPQVLDCFPRNGGTQSFELTTNNQLMFGFSFIPMQAASNTG